ncbi:MAG: LPS export ABC transporter ATP-binding protein [Rickettsiaceae bacterium]|nr:MAG: LPS export ABC transporter ATP-binding protein [Rickettsiaceae bacterium]
MIGKKLKKINNFLEISHISKSFDKRAVLIDVSITVEQGKAVGLFGPNGAGKTTCFDIIAGLIKPDNGTLSINGQDITNLPMYLRAKKGIGYLPQESSIFRGLSVRDNLKAVLEIVEQDKTIIEYRIDSLLNEFSINHLKMAASTTLSGGERRRLEIARAVAVSPKFILLDEPLAGVDPVAIADIKYLVSHLKDRDIGVLITDHNVRDTLDIVDSAYVIYAGTVLCHGTPQQVIASQQVRDVYLGSTFRI